MIGPLVPEKQGGYIRSPRTLLLLKIPGPVIGLRGPTAPQMGSEFGRIVKFWHFLGLLDLPRGPTPHVCNYRRKSNKKGYFANNSIRKNIQIHITQNLSPP